MTNWAKIPYLPERYEACDRGFIRTLSYERECIHPVHKLPFMRYYPEKVLSPCITKRDPSNGKHPVVTIRRGVTNRAKGTSSRSTQKRVAYLVASAFLGLPFDPYDRREMNHWRLLLIDGNPLNCAADNLKWVPRIGKHDIVIEAGVSGQTVYERNLQAFEKSQQEPIDDFMRRMYGADYYDSMEAA
ncbi:HNH endonuclease [Mycobacterium phage Nanosmite]|nr:HNH endonuclease [Mycobacterium phage Nanosmite]